MKQKEKSARITFTQGMKIGVDMETNEIIEWDIAFSLRDSHLYSQIPWDREVVKLFFMIHNIAPIWIDDNNVGQDYGNGTFSGMLGKVSA